MAVHCDLSGGSYLELLFSASPRGLDLLIAHIIVIGHQECLFPEREAGGICILSDDLAFHVT